MRAKEYLQQLHKLDIVIKQGQEEIARLNETLTGISSPKISEDKVKVSSNSSGADFERCVVKIDETERSVVRKIELYMDKRHKIVNEIQNLEDSEHIQILYKRYVEFKSFGEIASDMNYNCGYIRQLHGKALKKFESSNKI